MRLMEKARFCGPFLSAGIFAGFDDDILMMVFRSLRRIGATLLKWRYIAVALLSAGVLMSPELASAEPLKVLTAGAFKQVLLGIAPQFETDGRSVQLDADTVGSLVKRIQAGESFDLVIASPAALETLSKAGKVTHGVVNLARVGVGLGVRDGADKPDIGTVEDFKRALLKARAVAYVDPAAGGTSGIYISGLLDRLGIGPQIRAKSVLVKGGSSADRVVSGEADIAIQQISEILPVKGVVLVGPLPAEIQSYTTYSAGLASTSGQTAAAQALIQLLRGRQGVEVITSKGMEPVL
jgi:molybdate transport system substrate-binding protein